MSYTISETKTIQRIDLQFPDAGELNISDCRLMPVDVPIPIVKCEACNNLCNVAPDFVIPGTSLTLAASLFVAGVYHAGKNGWRRITQKYCPEEYGIAHTTLYRAYHALGDKLCSEDILCEKLKSIYYGPLNENPTVIEDFISTVPRKAIKEKQKLHEERIIWELILLILSIEEGFKTFYLNLWRLAEDIAAKPAFKKGRETRGRPKAADSS